MWKFQFRDFLGGPVVKNLPANAGPMGSLIQEDSTCSGADKPMRHNYWAQAPRVCALQQKKPLQWVAHAWQPENSPYLPQLEKACMQQQRSSAIKIKLS